MLLADVYQCTRQRQPGSAMWQRVLSKLDHFTDYERRGAGKSDVANLNLSSEIHWPLFSVLFLPLTFCIYIYIQDKPKQAVKSK